MRMILALAVLMTGCHHDEAAPHASASAGGGCPFKFGAPHVAAKPDGPRAPARPALGFALGTTTLAELDRWAADHGIACKHQHGNTSLECTAVPGALLGGGLDGTSVWFELDGGVLRAVRSVRNSGDVEAVANELTGAEAALTAADGAPHARDGSAAPAVLAHGALRQAMVEYRYWDYRAVVRATNMGPGHGFAITESYTAYD